MVFEPEQRRELLLVEFLDAHAHVMREHEIQEELLLGVEPGVEVNLRIRGPDFSGGRWVRSRADNFEVLMFS